MPNNLPGSWLTLKEPHTALFVAPTGVGKTHLALDLLEREYLSHFDFIVILCPTLRYNKTYKSQRWFWNDPCIILVEPDDQLYEWIEKLGSHFAGSKTLFLIDDIISDKNLDKRRKPLLGLAISGRHKNHSLWLLMQSYTAIAKNIRRQVKMLYIRYPDNRTDLNTIHEETDIIETPEEQASVKEKLKQGEHTCLIMRKKHPRDYQVW